MVLSNILLHLRIYARTWTGHSHFDKIELGETFALWLTWLHFLKLFLVPCITTPNKLFEKSGHFSTCLLSNSFLVFAPASETILYYVYTFDTFADCSRNIRLLWKCKNATFIRNFPDGEKSEEYPHSITHIALQFLHENVLRSK